LNVRKNFSWLLHIPCKLPNRVESHQRLYMMKLFALAVQLGWGSKLAETAKVHHLDLTRAEPAQ
jgi:hypothetical protein